MLLKARRRLARDRAANAAFVQGDGARLPFRVGSFDVAFLVAVLGEVPDPEGCIESLRRVLRPGGLLSLTETIGDPDALTQEQARALVERNGFEVEAVFTDRVGFTLNARSRSQRPSAGRRYPE
jgi:ubiquinone/menaquinone biosynthesis C-methylase UbiE